MALMSGAWPDGAGGPPADAELEPALAMFGVACSGAELDTWYAIPATNSTQRAPAPIQTLRSEGDTLVVLSVALLTA
jgi:hypothetical protein